MALPGDVTTCTISFGPYTDASGAVLLVGKTGTLYPVDPATDKRLSLVHVATGQDILPADLTITIGADGTDTVGPIPHTDNAGLSTVGFAYRVKWELATGSKGYTPGNKTFAVPTASGATVDYDLLDVADAVPGVLVPMGVSAGVADAAVSALIPTSSLTQTALDARYLNEGSGAGGALSGSYPNPGLNVTAVDALVAGAVADEDSDTSVALTAAFGGRTTVTVDGVYVPTLDIDSAEPVTKGCRVYAASTTNQVLASEDYVPLTLNTVEYNDDTGLYTPGPVTSSGGGGASAYGITVNAAGMYLVQWITTFRGGGKGERSAALGRTVAGADTTITDATQTSPGGAGYASTPGTCVPIRLVAGTQLWVVLYVSTEDATTVSVDDSFTFSTGITISRLGA